MQMSCEIQIIMIWMSKLDTKRYNAVTHFQFDIIQNTFTHAWNKKTHNLQFTVFHETENYIHCRM